MGYISQLLEIMNMSQEEMISYIKFIFDVYLKRQGAGTLYKENDQFPEMIINLYYNGLERAEMEKIFEVFKNNYLYVDQKRIADENDVEDVHTKEERQGLYEVYNAIQTDKIYIESIGINSLFLLHQKLYSLAPYPEFSGKFRTEPAHLANAAIELSQPEDISKQVNDLVKPVNDMISEGMKIRDSLDYSKIIEYIDKCVTLHCKLIKIHPFNDGNGRTTRAFMNALLKIAGVPPVYIKPSEKEEYHMAMEKALVDENYDDILTFFRYKVCDSIIEFDLSLKRGKTK